jgi:hypothetical protein
MGLISKVIFAQKNRVSSPMSEQILYKNKFSGHGCIEQKNQKQQNLHCISWKSAFALNIFSKLN